MKLMLFGLTALCMAITAWAYTPTFSRAGYFEAEASPRTVYSMNVGWQFERGDGYTARVNVPHTLNVVGFETSGGTNYRGPATYVKTFDFTPTRARQFLHFEAVMGKSAYYLNGEKIGERFGGYHPVHLEVTGKLKAGSNVLKVTCDNRDDPDYPPGKAQAQLDFSYFGGIYRDVWLVETGAVAVSEPGTQGGVYVATQRLAEGKWQVTARVTTDGEGTVRRFYEGKEVPETFTVTQPAEWTPDTPNLHFLRVEAYDRNGTLSDAVRVRFGFRDVEITPEKGLILNGKPWRKIIGGNRHQDFAFVGNALSNSLHYRDAVKLREAGMTCIRNAHYPQDPAFMDACDEVGLFVIVNTPGWQFWNSKPIFAARVLDDIRGMVRRDRSRASLFFWEPILNETWYPDQFAHDCYNIVQEEAPLGPKLCACDFRARGREPYEIYYCHPHELSQIPEKAPGIKIRATFTREWGDYVDDWYAHNSPARADRAWGEVPQLVQAAHHLDSRDPDHPVTSMTSLKAQPIGHFGGCLWHSFDHARGYHPDMFYGGIMTSARIPKTSYWMFKAELAKPGPRIPNVHLDPFVFVAHDLTPFSPRELTIYSNVAVTDTKLFGKPLVPQGHYRYTTEDGKGFSFYDIQLYDNPSRRDLFTVTGNYGGTPFVKRGSYRRSDITLTVDTQRTQPVADGSDLVAVVATLADEPRVKGGLGTPKHLCTERIRFAVEGPAEIVETEDRALNPQQTRYGEAVVLLRMGTKPGNVTVRAAVDRPGDHVWGAAAVTFDTVAPSVPMLFDTPAPLAKTAPLPEIRRAPVVDLKDVGRQQSAFGEQRRAE